MTTDSELPSIAQALSAAREQLAKLSDTARLDAELLLVHVLGKTRSYLYGWPEQRLDAVQHTRYRQLIERRVAGEPLAYLTGEREFWSLQLRVTRDTLIPRPDTETLIEAALALIAPDAGEAIADLGTGTGAIALALASERPHCHITATDRSAAALAVARDNARRLGLDNLVFREGDWCRALDGATPHRYALIVSNPPYIASGDPHLEQGDVRHEPRSALAAGPEGLDDLRRIIACAPRHLRAGGHLLLEHGYDQADAVARLFQQAGYESVRLYRDAGGRPRVTGASYPSD